MRSLYDPELIMRLLNPPNVGLGDQNAHLPPNSGPYRRNGETVFEAMRQAEADRRIRKVNK